MPDLDLLVIHSGAAHGIVGNHPIYGALGDDLVAVEPPLWARLIAGYARDRGFSVKICDAEAEKLSPEGVATIASALKPRLICLAVYGHQPSASTQQMDGAGKTAQEIKKLWPESKIIMVGGHVSALPEQTLLEEEIDFACKGEGPVTIVELLNLFTGEGYSGSDFADVPGLVWDVDDPQVNPPAPLLDINQLHGDVWDLLPMEKYRAHNWQCFGDIGRRQPYASIYTSLGCPYKCLAGDTLVNTIFGPVEIQHLAKNFKTVPVFTYDPGTGTGKICTAENIRKYGDERLVRVHFDDGTHIDCTPDHGFMQFKWGNGKAVDQSFEWACEAQDLKPGAHVRALRIESDVAGYPVASWKRRGRAFVHRMVAEWMLGRKLEKKEQVHHQDRDKGNWLPENLEVFSSAKDHFARHPEVSIRMRENNPTANGMGASWRANISKAVTGLRRSEEARENYRKAAIQRSADLGYIDKLRVAAKARESRGYRWYTALDGRSYRAVSPRSDLDVRGRVGFNAHKPINHKVVRVELLNGLRPVYCLTVPETGWFYANNVLVKNCSFCCINAPFGTNRYRMREPAQVVNEVERLYHDYGVKTFKIVDEMFVLNERHYGEICERLASLPYVHELNFWAYARVDTVRADKLELLRRAGFRWLALGVESGSKYVRDGAQKRLKNDDIVGVVRAIQAADINVIANYIFGLPDDTKASMMETLELAQELNAEFANFYCAQAYPGSPLYDEAVKKKWTLPASWRGYSQHNEECRPLDTLHISAAEVLQFRDVAFNTYFCAPHYLDMIKRKFGPETLDHVCAMTKYRLRRKLLEAAA